MTLGPPGMNETRDTEAVKGRGMYANVNEATNRIRELHRRHQSRGALEVRCNPSRIRYYIRIGNRSESSCCDFRPALASRHGVVEHGGFVFASSAHV